MGSETYTTMTFSHLILPEKHPPHTNLLDLQPLPKSALDNPQFQNLYNFDYFNPIQSQIFHSLYHSDTNALIGAPTGSGKTIAAEIAIFKVFRDDPEGKCVYIAPMKALVRERISDWKIRFEQKLGKKVVELTGDITPDFRAIMQASVIVTTPEKWDAVSRSWQTRNFVQAVRSLNYVTGGLSEKFFNAHPFLEATITGLLPVVATQMVVDILPFVLYQLYTFRAKLTVSEIQTQV